MSSPIWPRLQGSWRHPLSCQNPVSSPCTLLPQPPACPTASDQPASPTICLLRFCSSVAKMAAGAPAIEWTTQLSSLPASDMGPLHFTLQLPSSLLCGHFVFSCLLGSRLGTFLPLPSSQPAPLQGQWIQKPGLRSVIIRGNCNWILNCVHCVCVTVLAQWFQF